MTNREADETSELDRIIPPEIKDDAFYSLIRDLAATERLRHVLEIGSSAGGGSTEAFVAGLAQNTGSPTLFCIEVSKPRFEVLRATYADRPFVQCYNMSSVSTDEFPTEAEVTEFYNKESSGLAKFPLPEVLRWLAQDIAYVRDAGVDAGAIERIKAEHAIDAFDMVLIDGSEFTGEVELAKVLGAKLILLDDTNTFKCFRARQQLLANPDYEVIADDQELRNGFSAFRRRADALPVHFFTIVLNGEPFIRYHETMLAQLPFRWHWHVVEGVAALRHDTAWSTATGGRVPDEIHRDGRSNDGTSEYLDDLARRFPGQVTIYRKPPGEFWDGKKEMVNAPLPNITEECLLWQVDTDELWTVDQVSAMRRLFSTPIRSATPPITGAGISSDPIRSSARATTTPQNPGQEWLRSWRFTPGDHWAAHEPPTLVRPQCGGRRADQHRHARPLHARRDRGPWRRLPALRLCHRGAARLQGILLRLCGARRRAGATCWRRRVLASSPTISAGSTDRTMFDDAATYRVEPIARRDAARRVALRRADRDQGPGRRWPPARASSSTACTGSTCPRASAASGKACSRNG